jgi:hypothetical protein
LAVGGRLAIQTDGSVVFEKWRGCLVTVCHPAHFAVLRACSYPAKGRYKIAAKVIDIFGNNTAKVVEVKV